MASRATSAEDLEAIRTELRSFLQAFDTTDAEDAQVRTDALISAMVNAGVLEDRGTLRGFHLDVALNYVRLPLVDREGLVARAEYFHDSISSYGGQPDEEAMVAAKELLAVIAAALETAIDAKLKKRTT